MKKEINLRAYIYLVYLVVFFSAVIITDSVPDHRVGYSDYDIYLNWVFFPVMFTTHGIISKLIINTRKPYFTLALTALFGIVEAVIAKKAVNVLLMLVFTVLGIAIFQLFIYLKNILISIWKFPTDLSKKNTVTALSLLGGLLITALTQLYEINRIVLFVFSLIYIALWLAYSITMRKTVFWNIVPLIFGAVALFGVISFVGLLFISSHSAFATVGLVCLTVALFGLFGLQYVIDFSGKGADIIILFTVFSLLCILWTVYHLVIVIKNAKAIKEQKDENY